MPVTTRRALLLASAALAMAPTAFGAALPAYVPKPELSGALRSVGSQSGTVVIAKMANRFMEIYPNVKIEAIGSGSGTAFPALIQGQSQMAPMSRPMSNGMVDEFTRTRGYAPFSVRVGIGGTVVFVHPSNPIRGVTRALLDGMYSNTYFLSERAILNWGDAGLKGAWTDRAISLYSISRDAGPWGQFRAETSTMASYFKPTVREAPTGEAVVDAVAQDPNGIGFAPIGFVSDRVKVLPVASLLPAGSTYAGYQISPEAGRRARQYIAPTPATFADESYPLTRYFRMYADHNPAEPMAPALREFLLFMVSAEAQSMMAEAGYLPLTPAIAAAELETIRRRSV
jgi:phosphate transport system substrate-binding protein